MDAAMFGQTNASARNYRDPAHALTLTVADRSRVCRCRRMTKAAISSPSANPSRFRSPMHTSAGAPGLRRASTTPLEASWPAAPRNVQPGGGARNVSLTSTGRTSQTSSRPFVLQSCAESKSLRVAYEGGGSAPLSMSVDRLRASVAVRVDFPAPHPFATLRRMIVASANCDSQRVQTPCRRMLVDDAPVLDAGPTNGDELFFCCPSQSDHNPSAPDIRIHNRKSKMAWGLLKPPSIAAGATARAPAIPFRSNNCFASMLQQRPADFWPLRRRGLLPRSGNCFARWLPPTGGRQSSAPRTPRSRGAAAFGYAHRRQSQSAISAIHNINNRKFKMPGAC